MTASADDIARRIAETIETLSHGVRVGEEGQAHVWRRESIPDAYRWAVAALDTRRQARTGLCPDCEGVGWVRKPGHPSRRCDSCTPAVVSDLATHLAASKAARDKLDRVADHFAKMAAHAAGGVNELGEFFALIDAGVPKELPHERHMPRTVTRAELEEAEAAQGRRAARDEGWGAA